eukprot:gene11808-11603_t
MPATVLVLVETINEYLPIIESNDFHVILAPTPAERAQAIKTHGGQIRAVLTRGPLGLYAEEIAALPLLEIICVIGAGYEHVDLQAASNRKIVVTNGAGVNAPSVADHAMALLLALVRGIPQTDAAVRRGEWPKVMRPSLAGKQLGILGLGAVGLEIARRAALGFGMEVSYHNRQPRDDVDYTYCASAVELARNSDFLVLATPGGVGTYHLIDRQALDALGPHGYLVNIGRGSVVVTADLVAALEQRRIGGAALDGFDDEPQVPDALKRLGNTVLTSHVAGLAPEAAHDTVQRVAENLVEHFAGRPVLTPIRPGEELDASLIDPYLKAHIPGLSGSARISQFPGGASNLTYLLEYPEQEFVLRRPPFGHKAKSAHDMGREFRILNQLKDGFPYCPKAYVHCTDESVIGAEFYVMERVKGIILRSDLPPELGLDAARTEALCKSFIDKFVELHQVDYSACGLADLGKPEGYVQRQIRGWSERYEKALTPDAPKWEAVREAVGPDIHLLHD